MSGITDPAEEYFKDGLWGWDGTQWRKLALLWGYTAHYAESESGDSVGVGDNSLVFSSVPSGEVWVVTYCSAYASASTVDRVQFQPIVGGAERLLIVTLYATAWLTIAGPAPLVLEEGDYMKVKFVGCDGGENIRAYACGYKMAVA